jgi:16S rRNA (guanine527-N7)-methyltransferase
MANDATAAQRLNELLASAGLPELDAGLAGRFETYLELLTRWNTRLNLTAIREREGILSRHFVESIACARAIPEGVATLLDFGSGAGFPGIPIALCRPEIAVTLAESQGKKAAFLQEALRTLALRGNVSAKRAETLASSFDCVTMRAVDRMERAVGAAAGGLVSPSGWLVLMVTRSELPALRVAAGQAFDWTAVLKLASSEDRVIAIARRRAD